MCVIVVQPENSCIEKEVAEKCFYNNNDGCGYAFVENETVSIRKGFKTFSVFWDSFHKDWEEHKDSPFLLHFRITTAGGNTQENLHPFPSTKGSAFAHNGTIHNFKDIVEEHSDSRAVASVINSLDLDVFSFEGRVLLRGILGDSNKGVFLFPDKKVAIFNASEGVKYKGLWFSNESFKKEIVKHQSGFGGSTWDRCRGCQSIVGTGVKYCVSCRDKGSSKSCALCFEALISDEEDDFGICEPCWTGISENELFIIPNTWYH